MSVVEHTGTPLDVGGCDDPRCPACGIPELAGCGALPFDAADALERLRDVYGSPAAAREAIDHWQRYVGREAVQRRTTRIEVGDTCIAHAQEGAALSAPGIVTRFVLFASAVACAVAEAPVPMLACLAGWLALAQEARWRRKARSLLATAGGALRRSGE